MIVDPVAVPVLQPVRVMVTGTVPQPVPRLRPVLRHRCIAGRVLRRSACLDLGLVLFIGSHLLLGDEINRASPKTQSALLEAMQEHHVTLEGNTLALPDPFLVVATQNPIEYEGTFPLPEAQLDRFLVKLSVGYPTLEEEDEILRRRADRREDQVVLHPAMVPDTFLAMRAAVESVHVEPAVRRYMVELAAGTRGHAHVVVGTSPRGSLALLKTARAWAAMEGRGYVLPDDVKRMAPWALGHRIVLDPGMWNVPRSERTVVDEVVGSVPVPVLQDRP